MDDIEEPQDRYDLRKKLVTIRKAIRRMKHVHAIDIETLQKHKIQVLPLVLEDDEFMPKFFTPHPHENLKEPRNDEEVHFHIDKSGFFSSPKEHAFWFYLYLHGYTDGVDTRPWRQRVWLSKQ